MSYIHALFDYDNEEFRQVLVSRTTLLGNIPTTIDKTL